MEAKQMDFDYFSSYDSEQFQFIRIPKIMLTDARFKNLSFSAKGLYGLLLDRVGLSKENGWLVESGRVYIIYTIEQVADAMGCGRDCKGLLSGFGSNGYVIKAKSRIERLCPGVIRTERNQLPGSPSARYEQ